MLSIKRASISAKMAPTWHLAFDSWGHNMALRRTGLSKDDVVERGYDASPRTLQSAAYGVNLR